ncbi:barnase inhibitor [Listeria sp. FSL L7-1509]|uniref:Barnase inhibitor n=1 Tax=Listeria immobilis TaxID=2713502 RepID=A0ABR6T045_9LIST|nr:MULTISPECIES: barstar family protein [Listeria]MBC1484517.1 barnase inhibitor [Listeria immobilis]MBC1508258.1 barnase inhibitor [Listeria immobilis]MBC1511254.1 barnase inhibitor [Listeria immobilis]MBC1839519.1 barnase inhibitor [Listeria seeligeri]MBC6313691.1 barnase inhibitor [Listeria immobilis]
MDDLREEVVKINLANVTNKNELQVLLKNSLDFPEFYGENWDAFWDTITGLVELPEEIIFEQWSVFSELLPEEAIKLTKTLEAFNTEYPMLKCKIVLN